MVLIRDVGLTTFIAASALPQLPGQLGVLQNITETAHEMLLAAESKRDIASSDVLPDLLATVNSGKEKLLEEIQSGRTSPEVRKLRF